MKLIIDIPQELKQKIDEGFTNQVIINKLWDAAKNGIPLEQIRAEIEQSRYGLVNDGLDLALKIIDKHTK